MRGGEDARLLEILEQQRAFARRTLEDRRLDAREQCAQRLDVLSIVNDRIRRETDGREIRRIGVDVDTDPAEERGDGNGRVVLGERQERALVQRADRGDDERASRRVKISSQRTGPFATQSFERREQERAVAREEEDEVGVVVPNAVHHPLREPEEDRAQHLDPQASRGVALRRFEKHGAEPRDDAFCKRLPRARTRARQTAAEPVCDDVRAACHLDVGAWVVAEVKHPTRFDPTRARDVREERSGFFGPATLARREDRVRAGIARASQEFGDDVVRKIRIGDEDDALPGAKRALVEPPNGDVRERHRALHVDLLGVGESFVEIGQPHLEIVVDFA